MRHVTVLGTGLLGAGFAENLLEKGEQVVVWNRTASKTEALVNKGAKAAATSAEAVAGAARVHVVLSADDAVDSVLTAALPSLPPGVPVFDHSTNAPARVAARHVRLRAKGVRYVPAPVFMGPSNASSATGLMLLSASDAEAAEFTPILSTMTGKVWHVGERSDLAAVHKLAGNGMLIGLAGILGDLFAVGANNGLSPNEVLGLFDVFRAGGAIGGIGQRVQRGSDQPASFELTMARKDVGLMIDAAGTDLTVLGAIAGAMDNAILDGHGNEDFVVFTRTSSK